MNFSTALKLNDVDDYITPSLECIKPVKVPTEIGKTKSIAIGDDGTYVATTDSGEKFTLEKAKIDLNDCLACSGCITTAETILVSQHSVDKFLELLENTEELDVAVALSPQSLSSLTASLRQSQGAATPAIPARVAEAFGADAANCTEAKVKSFCVRLLRAHSISSRPLLDTTWARDVALAASAEEFVGAFKGEVETPVLPVLTGICPGWVCYAEKTHFKIPTTSDQPFLLQHISKVRSPQQILAAAMKRSSPSHEASPRRLFLVFVMPCYDKKLEASRTEFLFGTVEKEVDLVLGTNEFVSVLDKLLEKPTATPVDTSEGVEDILPPIMEQRSFEQSKEDMNPETSQSYRHAGSGSGGYAFAVARHAAKELFRVQLPLNVAEDPRVLTRNLGNQDLQEILIFRSAEECETARSNVPANRTPYRHIGGNATVALPTPLMALAVANGFRNIQTVVQQLKRAHTKAATSTRPGSKEAPFDYVEVMACPKGCLNGGAQLKVGLADVSDVYFSMEQRDVLESELSKGLLARLEPTIKQRACYTTYRPVPKVEITNPMTLKW